jgi:hypothetical protein
MKNREVSFRANRVRRLREVVQIGVVLVLRHLHAEEIKYETRGFLRAAEVTGITNWIQYERPVNDYYNYHKMPGDIPSPKIPVEDLQKAVTNRWHLVGEFDRGATLAWGFCQNNEGTITSWKLLSGGWIAFESEWDVLWVIAPSTKISTNGVWGQKVPSQTEWPAAAAVKKIVVSNGPFGFPRKTPEVAKREAPKWLMAAISNGQVKTALTYKEALEGNRRLKLPERSSVPKTYSHGVLLTEDGKMFLWELYGHTHVYLQDSEGGMLSIEPGEKKP